MPYLLISATLLQERRYLISAADARIKTMMTSSQTSPMPHIIPDVMPFIIMVHLTWLASDKSQFLNGSKKVRSHLGAAIKTPTAIVANFTI
jgi:hypothetical protein